MKITLYEVEKLYNSFNHKITFNENITIILGQNGLGKTAMLTMLYGLFSHDFFLLLKYPYASLSLTFDNKQKLIIERDCNNDYQELNFTLKTPRGKTQKIKLSEIIQNAESAKRTIRKYIPVDILRHTDEEIWQIRSTGEYISTTEVISRFSTQFPQLLETNISGCPQWLEDVISSIKVDFIGTKRLQTQVFNDERMYNRRLELHDTIEEYAIDFIRLLSSTKNKAAAAAAEIDKTYPNRLIERFKEGNDKAILRKSQLVRNLNKLNALRNELIEVGLMDVTEDEVLDNTFVLTQEISTVFNVYVEDSNKKLSAYSEMSKRVKLFIDLINKHFLYKKITISSTEGFTLKSTITDEKILLRQLSSGEQHMFILYYHLLFKYAPNTLILLDEPEISLHISWQKDFIEDLIQIMELNPMTLLIATHAPSIVRSHWPLTCELDAGL